MAEGPAGCPERGGKPNVCRRCTSTKRCSEMSNANRNLHGHTTICASCAAADARKWSKNNRERSRNRKREWNQRNKDRVQATTKLWIQNNKEYIRDRDLRKKYGISADTYDRMVEQQNDLCAVCDRPCSSGYRLSVDHDHRCCSEETSCGDCVRGLVCGSCNRGLGLFNDDPDRLIAAAAYVKSYLFVSDQTEAA